MHTNRDLYQFVVGLSSRHAVQPRLEDYLSALWSLVREHRTSPSLTLADFAGLLDRAFTTPAAEPPVEIPDGDGFVGWENRILEQIRDLRDMAATGQLADEQRYFGIDSRRGGRWYNFDPFGYLECATVGTFGGDHDDDSARVLVPGKVVVLDPAGNLISMDPGELVEPMVTIEAVDWDTFTGFLECGQFYE